MRVLLPEKGGYLKINPRYHGILYRNKKEQAGDACGTTGMTLQRIC